MISFQKPTPKSPVPQSRTTKLVKRPFKSTVTASGAALANGSSNNATDSGSAKVAAAAAEARKAAAAKREAQRKQLLEMKRKQKLTDGQQNVKIFVPGSTLSNASETTTNGATVVDAS